MFILNYFSMNIYTHFKCMYILNIIYLLSKLTKLTEIIYTYWHFGHTGCHAYFIIQHRNGKFKYSI